MISMCVVVYPYLREKKSRDFVASETSPFAGRLSLLSPLLSLDLPTFAFFFLGGGRGGKMWAVGPGALNARACLVIYRRLSLAVQGCAAHCALTCTLVHIPARLTERGQDFNSVDRKLCGGCETGRRIAAFTRRRRETRKRALAVGPPGAIFESLL